MSNVHTSSVSAQPRGALGLFAKPSRGFCFPATAVFPGEPRVCPHLLVHGFSSGSLLSLCTRALLGTVAGPVVQANSTQQGPCRPWLYSRRQYSAEPWTCKGFVWGWQAACPGGLAPGICFLPTDCRELPVRGGSEKDKRGDQALCCPSGLPGLVLWGW